MSGGMIGGHPSSVRTIRTELLDREWEVLQAAEEQDPHFIKKALRYAAMRRIAYAELKSPLRKRKSTT